MKLSDLTFLQSEELFRKLRINLTHHSNALEGTTLSLGETESLLVDGITAQNKRLDEQLIILGFGNAYDAIIREANREDKILDSAFIKDLHYLIFHHALEICPQFVKKPVGAFRTDDVHIAGSDIELCIPSKIANTLNNLLYQYKSNAMDLRDIADFHAQFEKIHPFSDGNGRTGRLIMAFQCIQNDLIPPLIKDIDRNEYLDLLYLCQTKSDTLNKFVKFLEKCQAQSLEIVESLTKSNQNKTKIFKR